VEKFFGVPVLETREKEDTAGRKKGGGSRGGKEWWGPGRGKKEAAKGQKLEREGVAG